MICIHSNDNVKDFLIKRYGELKNPNDHFYINHYKIDIDNKKYYPIHLRINSDYRKDCDKFISLNELISILRDYEINKMIK